MPLVIQPALPGDAIELAALHTAVAGRLTATCGKGPWSSQTTERGMLFAMRTSEVFVARDDTGIVGVFQLATKKPWAIDPKYFTPCGRPLYLTGMAVALDRQRQGIGRKCLEEARRIATEFPAGAIRLDAYDAPARAGKFYARCGFVERGRVTYRGVPLIYYEMLLDEVTTNGR